MQTREESRNHWLKSYFHDTAYTITPLPGDASFRRYFRIHHAHKTFILMDAPPEKESVLSFLKIQALFNQAQICVPFCFADDIKQGFLLLSDFGDHVLLYRLTSDNAHTSYKSLIQILMKIQAISPALSQLPHFNVSHILGELAIFETYFLKTYLQLSLNQQETTLLKTTFLYLAQQLCEQPQVVIHRDYHSRNILCLPNHTFGIIDFQDAMIGPWTYDVVSLLKDCYKALPHKQRQIYLNYFYTLSPFSKTCSEETCRRFFEQCGLQRHLKVLGIFSRLIIRDGKKQYLQDIPLILRYVQEALLNMPEYANFAEWMNNKVHPRYRHVSIRSSAKHVNE